MGVFRPAYDYLVIGSGSAGAVIASRLAEGGSHSVLLLEAGPSDRHYSIQMPAALGLPLGNDRFNWFYHTDPEPHLGGRKVYEARGRVLGGSSSINGLNWVRGNPLDYDNWAASGLAGWSYADCLPYFKKAETFAPGANQYRGGQGPMRVERCPAENPLYQAFLAAGQEFGMPLIDDHNAFRQEGVHITQRNVHNGVRWNTAEAYLRRLRHGGNLQIQTAARVLRIKLDGRRTIGVDVDHMGETHAISADREVILCAGGRQVARHTRIWQREQIAFDPIHYLALLERKPGALDSARPLSEWKLPECFALLRRRLESDRSGDGTKDYIRVLRLLETHSIAKLARAIDETLSRGATNRDLIAQWLMPRENYRVSLFSLDGHPHLRGVRVAPPDLNAYRDLIHIDGGAQ